MAEKPLGPEDQRMWELGQKFPNATMKDLRIMAREEAYREYHERTHGTGNASASASAGQHQRGPHAGLPRASAEPGAHVRCHGDCGGLAAVGRIYCAACGPNGSAALIDAAIREGKIRADEAPALRGKSLELVQSYIAVRNRPLSAADRDRLTEIDAHRANLAAQAQAEAAEQKRREEIRASVFKSMGYDPSQPSPHAKGPRPGESQQEYVRRLIGWG